MSLVDKSSKSFANLMAFSEVLLAEGKTIKVTAGGYSMFPFLRKGDMVYINKCKTSEYEPGDIVVFKTPEKFIAHRILSINKKGSSLTIISKGDSLIKYDTKVIKEQLLGKIIRVKRKGNYIDLTSGWSKRKAKIIAFLSPGFIPVFWVFWNIVAVKRKLKSMLGT